MKDFQEVTSYQEVMSYQNLSDSNPFLQFLFNSPSAQLLEENNNQNRFYRARQLVHKNARSTKVLAKSLNGEYNVFTGDDWLYEN